MKDYLCCLLLLLSTACTNASLEQLRSEPQKGNEFQQKLSAYYLALSEEEQESGRYKNAQFFADKGLSSAYGQDVFAEVPRDHKSYMRELEALKEARIMLEALMASRAAESQPDDTAKAQTLYDCWLMRADAKAPTPELYRCKQQFYNRVQLLRHYMQQGDSASVAISDDNAPQATIATSYLLYFEWDKSVLSRNALDNLRRIAKELLSITKPYALVLNGHTDTSGSADYNVKLSQKRAVSVRDMLATFGVPKDIMTVFAFGETDPKIKTGDSVVKAKNRRVEIFIE